MIAILTTCEPQDADPLITTLLQKRLIACGNIIPHVRSMYWWNGEIQREEESLILMETTQANKESALQALEECHPYEVPKILHWEPNGNVGYKQWLQSVTAT